jgi:hypothetical protein
MVMPKSSKDLNGMMCLDLYLMSLSNEEYEKIKYRIGPPKENKFPLECWDIISQSHLTITTNTNEQKDDKGRKDSAGGNQDL